MAAFKRSGDCVPAVGNTAPPVAVPMSAVAPLADPHPLTTEGQPEADSPADVRPSTARSGQGSCLRNQWRHSRRQIVGVAVLLVPRTIVRAWRSALTEAKARRPTGLTSQRQRSERLVSRVWTSVRAGR